MLNRGFTLYCGQLGTVSQQLLDQGALGLNGVPLFHDQQGHQTVGNEEQNSQNRKQG